MNKPYFVLIFLCVLFGIHFYELMWDKKTGKTEISVDRWTLIALGAAYLATIAGGFYEFLCRGGAVNPLSAAAGFALLLCRFFLKVWAVKTLGDCWSSNVEIKESHRLIKSGPYGFLRHPVYSGRLIEVLAICLILNAVYTFLFSFCFHLIILSFRISNEERALVEKFGVEYIKYREKTGGLLPKP